MQALSCQAKGEIRHEIVFDPEVENARAQAMPARGFGYEAATNVIQMKLLVAPCRPLGGSRPAAEHSDALASVE